MCVCVCGHTRAYSHVLTQTCTLQPSSWGGRQQDLSKRGQRALALSWVCCSGEVGSPVLAPPPLQVALFQAYGTLATLLEQARVQGPPLDLLTPPREHSILGDACSQARCGGLWTGVCCQRPLAGRGRASRDRSAMGLCVPCPGHLSCGSPACPLCLVWPEPSCSPCTAGRCRLSCLALVEVASVCVCVCVYGGYPVRAGMPWVWVPVGVGGPGCRTRSHPSLAVVLQGSLPLAGGAGPRGGGARALVWLGARQSLLPLLWRRRDYQETAVQQPQVLRGGGRSVLPGSGPWVPSHPVVLWAFSDLPLGDARA